MAVNGTLAGARRLEAQDVFGIRLRTCGLEPSAELIGMWLCEQGRGSRSIGYINPNVYNHCFHDADVRTFIETCDLVFVDGVGISLASRWLGGKSLDRAVATQVFDRVLRDSKVPARALLIGATMGEVSTAAAAINARSAGIHVTDAIDGYRSLEDYQRAFEADPRFDVVLVGMGTPRSESVSLLAKQMFPHAIVWLVGGGTLRIYAGTKRRAPVMLSRLGLEWTHRVWYEPETRTRYVQGLARYARHLFQWNFARTP